MSTKLFVGSLSFNTTDDSLQAAFAEFGKVVSANVIVDRDNNRSKGFGFVEFETAEEAQAAVTGLDGKDVDGRAIHVSIAKPREDRPRGGGGGGGNFGSNGGGTRRNFQSSPRY